MKGKKKQIWNRICFSHYSQKQISNATPAPPPPHFFLSLPISLEKCKNYWKIKYIKKLKDLKAKKTKT